MKVNRRRFLAISAAAACLPAHANAATWRGHAFGADISMTLHGPDDITRPALFAARDLIHHIEGLFSLYDARSALVHLNRNKELTAPDALFIELMEAADRAYQLTEGRFDPTIQSMWRARAQGATAPHSATGAGWQRVDFGPEAITLQADQSLTFNGIAQGFATDKITDLLQSYGLSKALVNIGEYRGLGGPWRLALEDPQHGLLGTRTLNGIAVATSSATALLLGRQSHIMHPRHSAQWSTVSIEARTATLADSLSTGLILAPLDVITKLRSMLQNEVRRITLISNTGDLSTL